MQDILSALMALLNVRILHRDIKPENFMLNLKGQIKVVDFGCTYKLPDDKSDASYAVGTMSYLAPEQIRMILVANNLPIPPFDGESEVMSYGNEKTEVWALGITALELVVKEKVFKDRIFELRSLVKQYLAIHAKNLPGIINALGISQPGKTCLLGMLELNPEKRLTMEEARASEWLRIRGPTALTVGHSTSVSSVTSASVHATVTSATSSRRNSLRSNIKSSIPPANAPRSISPSRSDTPSPKVLKSVNTDNSQVKKARVVRKHPEMGFRLPPSFGVFQNYNRIFIFSKLEVASSWLKWNALEKLTYSIQPLTYIAILWDMDKKIEHSSWS
ncbi:serine threonine- kinase eg2 [Pyrrhoderma noxium]|uniref:non-specific serine/threonine protein kinase n=1 Tax=Pyrrhoderma noxium TaxID=2282107 RepID=A0A286UCS8_9AGAM|nr:serine threonine- kinase eg2 [Pyrrhoderma noxium]